MSTPLVLGLKVGPGPIHRRRFDFFDFNSKLHILKEEASKEANLPAENIDLVHHGKILDDQKTLSESGIRPGEMVYALKRNLPQNLSAPKRITEIEVQECVSFFRLFKHPAEAAVTLLLKIRDQGHSENFLSSMPSLANDPVAINFLREPELLAHMGDPDTIRKIAEKHPALIEAVQKISGFKDPKQSTSRSALLLVSGSPGDSDDEDIDIEADPDDDGDGSGSETQPSNVAIITPEQLSSALAMAGMSAGGSNSGSQSTTSTVSDSAVPGLREFLESLLAADRPSSSSPGSSRPIITNDAFSNALSQAFNDVSANSSTADLSSTSSVDPSMTAEEQANVRTYSEQLAKMQEMGLTDNRVNLRALIISEGDVNAAINLVLSHLT